MLPSDAKLMSAELNAKYLKFVLQSFVEDNRTMR